MSEGKDKKLEGKSPKKKKGKGKGLFLIIVIAVAVLASGSGVFFVFAKSDGVVKKEESAMFALDAFIVNLNDQGTAKFLKVSMQLELASQPAMERAKAKTPQIRDAVIGLLTSKTSDSLLSPEGKLQLKDEINEAANQILGTSTVKNVYFTEFITQ